MCTACAKCCPTKVGSWKNIKTTSETTHMAFTHMVCLYIKNDAWNRFDLCMLLQLDIQNSINTCVNSMHKCIIYKYICIVCVCLWTICAHFRPVSVPVPPWLPCAPHCSIFLTKFPPRITVPRLQAESQQFWNFGGGMQWIWRPGATKHAVSLSTWQLADMICSEE